MGTDGVYGSDYTRRKSVLTGKGKKKRRRGTKYPYNETTDRETREYSRVNIACCLSSTPHLISCLHLCINP